VNRSRPNPRSKPHRPSRMSLHRMICLPDGPFGNQRRSRRHQRFVLGMGLAIDTTDAMGRLRSASITDACKLLPVRPRSRHSSVQRTVGRPWGLSLRISRTPAVLPKSVYIAHAISMPGTAPSGTGRLSVGTSGGGVRLSLALLCLPEEFSRRSASCGRHNYPRPGAQTREKLRPVTLLALTEI